jgi:hypothetical protein
MSAQTPRPGEVWRRRDDGRLVVVAAADAESIVALEPVAGHKMRFATIPFCVIHASTGLALCPEDLDGAPGAVEASALRGLQQRPSPWLRALVGWARRHGHPELAALAGRVLVLRGENPGTPEASDG